MPIPNLDECQLFKETAFEPPQGVETEYPSFRVETMVAQFLEFAVEIAKEHVGDNLDIKDIVLTVPSFWTQFEPPGTLGQICFCYP